MLMTWSDISWNPPARTLRQFAVLWLAFFGGLAVWHAVVHGRQGLGWGLGGVAVVVAAPGLFWPRVLKPLFIGCSVATFPIGWLVSRLVLAGMFFGVLTPVALLFRWAGRDVLRVRRAENTETYWLPKPQAAGP